MIAINLLRRTLLNEQRQRRRCQGEAAVVVVIVMATVAVCGGVWAELDRSLGQLQEEKARKVARLLDLERTHGKLESTNRQTAALRHRSQQVTRLLIQQRRPIQLLDAVSRSLDSLKLWLDRLEMDQEQVRLVGFAESKAQIVQFAQYLKRDGLFQDVEVLEAARTSEESSAYHFTMNLRLITEPDYVTSS